jgi:hypothetical protein
MEQDTTLPAVIQNYSIAEIQPVSTDSLVKQVNAIQHAMTAVMQDGVHYGLIPGCGDKPALLKAGAEKIGLMFRLGAHFDVEYIDLQGGHREVKVLCTLKSIQNSQVIGQGVGSCSTMESKYRYAGSEKVLTSVQVPKNYWDSRSTEVLASALGNTYPAKMLLAVREGGQWFIAVKGEKAERKDLADVYNTILKMAKKRAHVDAIITATAAGDIFTQDIEENPPEVLPREQQITPKPAQRTMSPEQKKADEDRPLPAMDRQPPEAATVSYNVPFKVKGEDMEQVRKALKAKGFRFNATSKHWDGKEVFPQLAKYRVNVTVEEQAKAIEEEQAPTPEFYETDNMPSFEQEEF